MSTQAPQSAAPEWKPRRREHGGLRQVRRGQDRKLIFKGQDQDEEVKQVVRQHPIFLARPALPGLAILLLFLLSSLFFVRLPSFAPVLGLFDLILALLFLAAVGYFLWRDFFIWWVNIDIVTNKRIVSCRGFLQPTRKIITLDKVMQIAIDQESLWSVLLSYGHVHIYLAGGQHILKNVPRPRNVRDAVQGISESFKAGRPVPEPPPALKDPDMQAAIARLSKKDQVPTLPDADARYAHHHKPEHMRGPLRRFGGPLRIPAEVHYASDEYTVMYIQRSKWLLILRLLPLAFFCVVALALTFIFSAFALFTIIASLILLTSICLITVNYVDDLFILTNKRVIDIERKYIFFYEARVEAEYKNIRDTRVKITNIFENLLDIGSVYVETPGNNPDINMTMIDHPFFIADKITEVKNFKDKVDKAKDKNAQREELSKWFTSVAIVLEKKMVSRGVPNLQTMDLWTAAAMAAEMGMKVVPVGEDASYPQIPPGRIVSQDPLPGTLMAVDTGSTDARPQINVVLSKHT
ncbi:MAG TPA: PH domain-containing protein [Ktedonobacteraceae bacterium]|jgi:hypothetical protein